MKRLVLFVVALVFAFSTTVMAAEPAAAPVKKEEAAKVEKAPVKKAKKDVKKAKKAAKKDAKKAAEPAAAPAAAPAK